jgi:hypothetical protein
VLKLGPQTMTERPLFEYIKSYQGGRKMASHRHFTDEEVLEFFGEIETIFEPKFDEENNELAKICTVTSITVSLTLDRSDAQDGSQIEEQTYTIST